MEGEERISLPTDLTPDAANALLETGYSLTPDGATIVTAWLDTSDLTNPRERLVAIDRASGARRTLTPEGNFWYLDPACSPDGRWVVGVRGTSSEPDEPMDQTVWLVDLASGEGRELTPDFDLWPQHPVWTPDWAPFCSRPIGTEPWRCSGSTSTPQRSRSSRARTRYRTSARRRTGHTSTRSARATPSRRTWFVSTRTRPSRRRPSFDRSPSWTTRTFPAASNGSRPPRRTAPPFRLGWCCRELPMRRTQRH